MRHAYILAFLTLCLALNGCKQPEPKIEEAPSRKLASSQILQKTDQSSDQKETETASKIHPSLHIKVFQPQTKEKTPYAEITTTIYGSVPSSLCKVNDIYDLYETSEECALKTPFITETDYLKYALSRGDIFTTDESPIQYQIIDGNSEEAYVLEECDGEGCDAITQSYFHANCAKEPCDKSNSDKVVRIIQILPPQNGQIIPSASASQIPELVPMPVVTTPPEERLTFKKSLKSKKGKVEYLIFHDSQLQTDCYISMLNNQEVLNEMHYCIPFSGVTKELEHPLAATKTARQFDAYPYCINISVEKRNIPGLADFFKAFNPDYYNENLKRFIDNPFQITRPQNSHKKKENCGGRCRPYDVQCVQNYYSKTPAHLCNLAEANRYGQLNSRLDICKLVNPFITFSDYIRYDLRPGDVFLTASAKKGEKALHQYWQVFDMTSLDFQFNGTPETIWELNTCRNTLGEYPEKVVQVRDLSSKDTYEVLYAPIMKGMSARDNYCKAFNNSLINEARTGQYALVESGSPLLKKK